MKKILFAFSLLFLAFGLGAQTIDISGKWRVRIDSLKVNQEITLPGTLDMAGIGVPNTLEPKIDKPQMLRLTRKHSFVGVAKYTRDIFIPKDMAKKPLEFIFERVMWRSRLYVDGKQVLPFYNDLIEPMHVDFEESLTTPHTFLLPGGLKEGKHKVEIVIDNSLQHDISFDNLAHAYTNDTQTMWNGVLGAMHVKALPKVSILTAQVVPDADTRTASFYLMVDNRTGKKQDIDVSVDIPHHPYSTNFKVEPGISFLCLKSCKHAAVARWDEFNPNVLSATVTVKCGDETDNAKVEYGFRSLVQTPEGKLTVNDRPVFLRGTLECCIFPLTGVPPTDEESWEKVFGTAREYGLNHIRFHSWCPPEAAFKVADRMGFYLQVELPQWSLHVGQDDATNAFLYREFDRIAQAYGNHPSFCLMTCGNELQPDFEFLNNLVRYMKRDPRRLYSTTSFTFEKGHGGHPEPEDQFFVTQWTDNGWVRGQGVFDQEYPRFNADFDDSTLGLGVPLISHEIGQYAVYPNLEEISKYTGVLDPLNFKAVRNDMEAKGLLGEAHDWMLASGRLAYILYKEEIERALKSKDFSGFQLLDIHDFPGQGTALVGLLDAFWDSKGICTPEEFRQFSSPVTPLLYFDKAVYKNGDNFKGTVYVANYSKSDLEEPATFEIYDGDKRIASMEIEPKTYPTGEVALAGDVAYKFNESAPKQLEMRVTIGDYSNSWPVWVYEKNPDLSADGIVVASDLDQALAALERGEKVLLSPNPDYLQGLEGKFVPVFWSPIHFPKQAGTMGLLCDPSHPALEAFPTESHTNWQWWDLLKNSRVIVADELAEATPIVKQVDNFANNRRLCSIFEANCGNGKLLFSAIDLLGAGSADASLPERKQLLSSLLRYMKSDDFAPSGSLTPTQLQSLFSDEAKTLSTSPESIY